MMTAFSARRADDFEALVSRSGGAPLSDREQARYAALLDLVADLRTVPDAVARPEFVGDLRSRLMIEAETALLPMPSIVDRLALPVHPTRRDRRVATVIGAAALLGATTSMAVAAQSAIPGDALYPVKRGIESAQTQFRGDDGAALLASASGRLAEVDELARRGTPEGIAAVPHTLDEFSEQASEAATIMMTTYAENGDDAEITRLREFTSTSMDHLLGLEASLPDSARDELVAAARNLAEIDEEARLACQTCPGGIDRLPQLLLTAGLGDAVALPVGVPSAQQPSRPAVRTPQATGPAPVSGQDVDGIEVPDLDDLGDAVGGATGGATGGDSGSGPGPGTGGPRDNNPVKPLQDPVKELTKALGATTTVTTAVPEAPAVGDVLGGVGTTVDGVTGQLGDGITGTTDGLVP
jgi:hypothetical protein